MLSTLMNNHQNLSRRSILRVAAILAVLLLVSSWRLPARYPSPAKLASDAKTTRLTGDDSIDPALYSPSITPLQNRLPLFGEVLKVQLPQHSAQRWSLIHKVFTHFNPGTPLKTGWENADRKQLYAKHAATCKRPDLVLLDDKQVTNARERHGAFIKTLPTVARGFSFDKGSRGIVTTVGAELMPIFVVSLRLLRRTGCALPVEVFVANFGDYEPKMCEKVLPSLNARCVLLGDDFMDVATPEGKPDLAAYQLKPFVILLSSFDEVLFLDADSFPVDDPEVLFESDPFKESGLIIWPDFWCASQSPYFYKITGLAEPAISERPSSESGQLLYDKSRHLEDLLLACYYGYYGPGLWYKLLSQGYPGEGDKETYLAAAMVLNATFYQPRQLPAPLPEGVADFAIAQVNPINDYASIGAAANTTKTTLPQAFIHHHFPKLDATLLMQKEKEFVWAQGRHSRMWGPVNQTIEQFGFDLEHEVWKAINYTACDLGNMFRRWQGLGSSCQFVQKHMRLVFREDEALHTIDTPI